MDFKALMPFGRGEQGEDPFSSMRRELDRVFDNMTRSMSLARPAVGLGAMAPRLDVKDTGEAIEVHAELPGVEEKDVEVQYAGGMLTLRGEKKQEREEKEKGYYLMERAYGSFMRQIPMPVEIDEARISARFEKGVLSVVLPKSPEAAGKVKKIEIGKTGAGS
ncbi:Hsp20/alpha crystallin family protein [Geminicoccaceae bacterium 1502E]|nr:Hsp20/alpha crystallin family protein [Geminicoccaceae bacterium 1502E]